MSNPSGIRRRHAQTAVIGDTVKCSFDILVYHVESTAIFRDNSRIILPGSSDHYICSGSQPDFPSSRSALAVFIINIVIYKYIFIIRTWGYGDLYLYAICIQSLYPAVCRASDHLPGPRPNLKKGCISSISISSFNACLIIALLSRPQASEVKTPGFFSAVCCSLSCHIVLFPGICSCLAGAISQVLILQLRRCICQHIGPPQSHSGNHAYSQNHGSQTLI